jgi:hypothetical protein
VNKIDTNLAPQKLAQRRNPLTGILAVFCRDKSLKVVEKATPTGLKKLAKRDEKHE